VESLDKIKDYKHFKEILKLCTRLNVNYQINVLNIQQILTFVFHVK